MIKKHHLLALIAACSIAFPATAQTSTDAESTKTVKAFNNLEVTINAGSTGIGFDFATYVHKMVRIRTGFDFTPQTGSLGYAPGWHPTMRQHRKMAVELTTYLKKLMNW